MRKPQPFRGFTLIELLMGVSIMAVFFFVVYQIFVGGSKSAEKGRWLNTAIAELRNSTGKIGKELKASSYPATLLSDAVNDAGEGANKATYFVRVPPKAAGGERIKTPTGSEGSRQVVMVWFCCEAEKRPNPGKITKYQLILETRTHAHATTGELFLLETSKSFTTTAPKSALDTALGEPSDTENKKEVHLVSDVASFIVELDPVLPIDSPVPMKIYISCRSGNDPKTHKEIEMMATPNTGIKEL